MERRSDSIEALFLSEIRRRMFEESRPRVLRCLRELDEESLWWRPNASSNAVGNLVLHLAGNVRQWIVHSLGGERDGRRRQEEFDERGPLPKAEVMRHFEAAMDDARRVIDELDPAALVRPHEVQGFRETGLSILVHVVEHLSYHAGQIAWITKMRADRDLGFYADEDLDVTG